MHLVIIALDSFQDYQAANLRMLKNVDCGLCLLAKVGLSDGDRENDPDEE